MSTSTAATPAPAPGASGRSDFINRAGYTLLMAYSMLGLVAQGIKYVVPVVMLIQVMMFYEIHRINQKERKDRQMPYFKLLPWYFLFVTVFGCLGVNLREVLIRTFPVLAVFYKSFGFAVFGLLVIGFIAFVLSLRKGMYKYQIGQFTWFSMTLIFIVLQGALQISNMLRGMFFFLLPVSCVVHNDVWAYACGKLFGRTKLLALSPKKTLEGFIGAWIMTTIWAFWFAGYMPRFKQLVCPETTLFNADMNCDIDPIFIKVPVPLPEWLSAITGVAFVEMSAMQQHAVWFAMFASLIAPFGGFFASGLKRAFKLKDFGDLIPGHGGMTDRMDCQIITGLFTYVYLQTILYRDTGSCPSVTEMAACISALSETSRQQLLTLLQAKP